MSKAQSLSLSTSVQTVFKKYSEFSGKASRPEFWWWVLFTVLVGAVIGSFDVLTINQNATIGGLLNSIWGIVILLPTLAVSVRRLRDAGYAWQNIFWGLVPFAGAIVLIIYCAQPTKK